MQGRHFATIGARAVMPAGTPDISLRINELRSNDTAGARRNRVPDGLTPPASTAERA